MDNTRCIIHASAKKIEKYKIPCTHTSTTCHPSQRDHIKFFNNHILYIIIVNNTSNVLNPYYEYHSTTE